MGPNIFAYKTLAPNIHPAADFFQVKSVKLKRLFNPFFFAGHESKYDVKLFLAYLHWENSISKRKQLQQKVLLIKALDCTT